MDEKITGIRNRNTDTWSSHHRRVGSHGSHRSHRSVEHQVIIVIVLVIVRVFIGGSALDIIRDSGTAAPLEQQDDPSPSDLK